MSLFGLLFKELLLESVFSLVILVEAKISAEMEKKKGAIMHDGWYDNGTHYNGLYAVYVRESRQVHGNQTTTKSEVLLSLLSMSPMAQVCGCVDNLCECTSQATRFDTVTHVAHIQSIDVSSV